MYRYGKGEVKYAIWWRNTIATDVKVRESNLSSWNSIFTLKITWRKDMHVFLTVRVDMHCHSYRLWTSELVIASREFQFVVTRIFRKQISNIKILGFSDASIGFFYFLISLSLSWKTKLVTSRAKLSVVKVKAEKNKLNRSWLNWFTLKFANSR